MAVSIETSGVYQRCQSELKTRLQMVFQQTDEVSAPYREPLRKQFRKFAYRVLVQIRQDEGVPLLDYQDDTDVIVNILSEDTMSLIKEFESDVTEVKFGYDVNDVLSAIEYLRIFHDSCKRHSVLTELNLENIQVIRKAMEPLQNLIDKEYDDSKNLKKNGGHSKDREYYSNLITKVKSLNAKIEKAESDLDYLDVKIPTNAIISELYALFIDLREELHIREILRFAVVVRRFVAYR